MTRPGPCRLFIILARNAPTGVIFRRGPSRWVQIIKWDTERDVFEPGQWFHGRIYEKRCDLSPDGRLMIYFARKITGRTLADREYTYAWTAISKPPWLTALALWPKGDCWHGGGLFLENHTVFLNHWPEVAKPHKDHQPRGLKIIPNPGATGEDLPLFHKRLLKYGWQPSQEWELHHDEIDWQPILEGQSPPQRFREARFLGWDWHTVRIAPGYGYITDSPFIHEKPHESKGLTLIMASFLAGYKAHHRFAIRDEIGGARTSVEGAVWADWDRHGRLVYARDGKLFSGELEESGKLSSMELADFNSLAPEPKESPDWAKVW